jgi:type II secretory pathway pseudopilin PulG
MVVIAVILILAGLVLSISGYAMDKGKRSRAETEIAAMSAAMESYKADNGIYPRDSTNNYTDNLNAAATPAPSPSPAPSAYTNASFYLFTELSGLNASQQPVAGKKSYFTFKPQMLGHSPPTSSAVAYIRDPWGNSYGYSTAGQKTPPGGFNPTYDLWSTANDTTGTTVKWIKNW